MAIEPLSSAMTYQAQNTQQVKPAAKQTVENTDVTTQELNNVYDATFTVVASYTLFNSCVVTSVFSTVCFAAGFTCCVFCA